MTSADRPLDLHAVLDSNFRAHRKDIYDFAGGHLNPDKLAKVESTATHTPWKSAEIQRKEVSGHLMKQTRKQADKFLADKIEHMQNTLVDFSVGTSGTIREPQPPDRVTRRTVSPPKNAGIELCGYVNTVRRSQPSETDLEDKVLSGISRLLENQDGRSASKGDRVHFQQSTPSIKYLPSDLNTYRSVLTEEMKLPELMLPSVQEDIRVPPSMKDPTLNPKQRVNEITDKNFTTTHFAGITRKDRFSKILDFDRNVLHRYETMERNVRDGRKAAEHLERKLVLRLLELKEHRQPPYSVNFEKLQVYDEVWRDLCVDSSIFGALLLEIKHCYDSRLLSLLDNTSKTSHSEILTCLSATDGLSNFTENDVREKKQTVDNLEEDGRKTLLRNYELHQGIEKEKAIAQQKREQKEKEERENRLLLPLKLFGKKKNSAKHERSKKEPNPKKRLEILRSKIWEKLEEISKVRGDLRENFVPKTLHRNMQQAVQDTESEMQKLMQQREYVTKNTDTQLKLLRYDLHRFDSMSGDAAENFLSSLGTS